MPSSVNQERLPHHTQSRVQNLLKIAEPGLVVAQAAANDFFSLFASVGVSDLANTGCRTWRLFVCQEIMAQAVKHRRWNIADIGPSSIGRIVFQHGDNLIVGLILIDHAQATDGNTFNEDVAMLNRSITQHADVKRVAIALHRSSDFFRRECSNTLAAISLWHEPIQSRAYIGVLLRTIYLQVSGYFVDLVLQRIGRHNFDEALHDFGYPFTRRYSMPWMRFEQYTKQFPEWLSSVCHRRPTLLEDEQVVNERSTSSHDQVYAVSHITRRLKLKFHSRSRSNNGRSDVAVECPPIFFRDSPSQHCSHPKQN